MNINLKSCCFNFEGNENATFSISIRASEPCSLENLLIDEVPPGVEIVPPDGEPTQEFWVWEGHHYLTIYLNHGGNNPDLTIPCDEFVNCCGNPKYLDVVFSFPSNELICIKRKVIYVDK